MPLKKDASKGSFGHNVAQLIRDGYDRKQALAIAYDIQREASKSKKKSGS